jgi:hypothetical protein
LGYDEHNLEKTTGPFSETKNWHETSKVIQALEMRLSMKKAGIFVLALSFVLLMGCSAPSDGEGVEKSTPPTNAPVSENPPSPDLPDEKEIVFEIEGTQETMTLQKYAGENFTVYIDKANFTAEESAQEVKFLLANPEPAAYPDSSIAISYVQGVSIKEKKDALSNNEAYTNEGEREIGENTALWFHAKLEPDAQWNSPTQDIYLIEAEDGFFTITVSCYLEAAEGWGARMFAMIGTFSPTR